MHFARHSPKLLLCGAWRINGFQSTVALVLLLVRKPQKMWALCLSKFKVRKIHQRTPKEYIVVSVVGEGLCSIVSPPGWAAGGWILKDRVELDPGKSVSGPGQSILF
ncbi:hypothetical protein ILYODFUR_033376 [Ilyodon furcidens]|uniref:Uncharacterized protein n=1 Tax=Ilyodon furcidens TaxID=33524 RepID=A0ABV0V883_9TELE